MYFIASRLPAGTDLAGAVQSLWDREPLMRIIPVGLDRCYLVLSLEETVTEQLPFVEADKDRRELFERKREAFILKNASFVTYMGGKKIQVENSCKGGS